MSDVKADINREMELDELRRLQTEMQGTAREFEQSLNTAASDVASGVRDVERELNDAAAGTEEKPAAPTSDAAASAPKPAERQATLPGFDKI